MSDEHPDFPAGLNRLSHEVIGAAMAVHSALGAGLRERLYETALVHELRQRGLVVEQQVSFVASYQGVELPAQVIDVVVERSLILELKSVRDVADEHFAQMLGYLRLTGLPLGLVLNFGKAHLRDGIHRKINFPPVQARGVVMVRCGLMPVPFVNPTVNSVD